MGAFNPRKAIFILIWVLALLVWGRCAPASSPIPPEVAQNARDWPLANYDYSNTRNATGSTINSTNVKDLGVAWAYPVSGVARGNPVIADGVVYYQDFDRNVMAIDVYGNLKWQKNYDSPSFDPKGVSIGWGKVLWQSMSKPESLFGRQILTRPAQAPLLW